MRVTLKIIGIALVAGMSGFTGGCDISSPSSGDTTDAVKKNSGMRQVASREELYGNWKNVKTVSVDSVNSFNPMVSNIPESFLIITASQMEFKSVYKYENPACQETEVVDYSLSGNAILGKDFVDTVHLESDPYDYTTFATYERSAGFLHITRVDSLDFDGEKSGATQRLLGSLRTTDTYALYEGSFPPSDWPDDACYQSYELEKKRSTGKDNQISPIEGVWVFVKETASENYRWDYTTTQSENLSNRHLHISAESMDTYEFRFSWDGYKFAASPDYSISGYDLILGAQADKQNRIYWEDDYLVIEEVNESSNRVESDSVDNEEYRSYHLSNVKCYYEPASLELPLSDWPKSPCIE